MYKVKNMSTNRKIVCTLKDGSTLRLLPKVEKNLKDNQVTDYLISLSSKGIVMLNHIQDKKPAKKSVTETTDK